MTGPVYITVSPPSQEDLPFPATWGGSTKKDGMLKPAMAGCGESLSGGDWRTYRWSTSTVSKSKSIRCGKLPGSRCDGIPGGSGSWRRTGWRVSGHTLHSAGSKSRGNRRSCIALL